MKVVDANVLIDYLRNKPQAIWEVEQIGFSQVVVTSVTAMEVFRGVRDRKELADVRRLFKRFGAAVIGAEVHSLALEWAEAFCLSHSPIGISDLLLGAFAVLNDLELHTYNKKHFRHLPGLRLWES